MCIVEKIILVSDVYKNEHKYHGIMVPVVTRFLWPPEIPLIMSFPTIISAHMSNPSICNYINKN
jgi:hypothetical protein